MQQSAISTHHIERWLSVGRILFFQSTRRTMGRGKVKSSFAGHIIPNYCSVNYSMATTRYVAKNVRRNVGVDA
jgi:hypothetical protein